MTFRELIGNKILFFDGGMGTMLLQQGLKTGEIPDSLNLTAGDVVTSIHRKYLNSGANVITANTFGANPIKLEGSGYTTEEIVSAAITNAKNAANDFDNAFVALDIGPLGRLLKPYGDIDFDCAYNSFAEVVKAGVDADLILIETMGDLYEIKAAVLAAKENSDLPVVVTASFNENGRLLTGGDISSFVALLEGLGVDALGMNCGLGPKEMLRLLPSLVDICSLPIVVNANAGLPQECCGKTVYNVAPEEFAEDVKKMIQLGVSAVGGCCGTTPDHIRAVYEKCKDIPPIPITDKNLSVVCSGSKAVYLGQKPVIIGERLNPTGKKRLKQALIEQDFSYILGEALSQSEAGAHVLDVNVGLNEIDEPEMMVKTVMELQAVTSLPLQLDTSDTEALKRGIRIYNGKPMINSVNGKEESMNAIFPLVKKYGGVVVALTLDENGIPETTEGRIRIAEKIISRAAEFGIKKKDIIVDPLTMTVSTNSENANITLGAIRHLNEKTNVNTVLGVSNISFGLPQRDIINSIFFAMALQNGLSAGIINPASQAMKNAYLSYCALSGLDENFAGYIGFCTDSEPDFKKPQLQSDMPLRKAIISGLKVQAVTAAKELLVANDPFGIIENELIPALDEVGRAFESGRLFLPQLLMSAEAAAAVSELVKSQMSVLDTNEKKKGKVLLATVHGDIHDIGKNILKVLFENYNFDVIDLGKDVPPEAVVSAVVKENVPLVALSALMTTTVNNMETTINLLREKTDCKIMVGGAVLTQEYADKIGADFYSKDAMGAVRLANEFFNSIS